MEKVIKISYKNDDFDQKVAKQLKEGYKVKKIYESCDPYIIIHLIKKDNPVPQIIKNEEQFTNHEKELIFEALLNDDDISYDLIEKFCKFFSNKGVEANKELPKKKKSLVKQLKDLETNFEFAAYTNGNQEMLNRKIELLAEYLDSLGR